MKNSRKVRDFVVFVGRHWILLESLGSELACQVAIVFFLLFFCIFVFFSRRQVEPTADIRVLHC